MQLRFASDPGHGWLAVPLELLDRLGLLDRITTYSYLRGGTAHLEEDCDCSAFMAAAKEAGLTITMRGTTCAYRRSRIRGYDYYTPAAARRNLENLRAQKGRPIES
jgi:hypothetical protein